MKIVLIGASGFLGHYVLAELSAAGHDCLALTRYRPACRELAVLPRVTVRQDRRLDGDSLSGHMAGADAVVSMAGILNEKGRKGKGFHRVHVELVERVIGACRRSGVRRLVHVSALGAGQGDSHYLKSKGKAERLIREAGDIDATLIQPSVIFGAGDSFFNRFAGLLELLPVLPLACPESRMQPVWAGDVAALLRAGLEDRDAIGQTLVAVGPQAYSLRELVEFTAAVMQRKRRILGLPDGLARLQATLMDFVPGKPFSTDNYRSLQLDSTSELSSLPRYGIRPRSIEATVPAYLGPTGRQQRLDHCRRHAGR